jgi:hypothetical protein
MAALNPQGSNRLADRCSPPKIWTASDESHAILHHEAASKFLGQAQIWAKYSATMARLLMDFAGAIRLNAGNFRFVS